MKKVLIFLLLPATLLCTSCKDKNPPTKDGGLLQGVFSVSKTKKVQFSQGNLQYQASTQIWRFAENQYDMIGADNANISSSYSGWIDLFGWGTGNNPTLSSSDHNDYSSFFTDWGVNKISNGGNNANMWRTLTRSEWSYIFIRRANAKNLFGLATVAGVHGLVVFPDKNYGNPSPNTWQCQSTDWTTNQYSVNDWLEMEKAGAVFLPAAGCRYGTEMYDIDSGGFYWSSDMEEFTFIGGAGLAGAEQFPVFGNSVRLVKDVD